MHETRPEALGITSSTQHMYVADALPRTFCASPPLHIRGRLHLGDIFFVTAQYEATGRGCARLCS